MRRFFPLVAAAILVASAAPGSHGARPRTTLRVFAAASLSDAFHEIERMFERAHPGVDVQLNLAGTQVLAAQIEQGAACDVFASADSRWMDYLRERSLVGTDTVVFARNVLVAIVPRTNPARIGRLGDLGRPGVKVVLGADVVPVGFYSREVLGRLSRMPGFDRAFPERVLANLVSAEENVKAVVAKVQLGEADAGMVYRSDITPMVSRYVRVFEIPEPANVLASYPIAVLPGAGETELGHEFVRWVLSADGQRVLAKHRLIPVTPAAK